MQATAIDWISPSIPKRKSDVLSPEITDLVQKFPKTSRPGEFADVIGGFKSPQLLGLPTRVYSERPMQGTSRGPMTYPRKRAVAACLRCRARKTKCDNQRPSCGFCAGVGAECQYEGVSEHSS